VTSEETRGRRLIQRGRDFTHPTEEAIFDQGMASEINRLSMCCDPANRMEECSLWMVNINSTPRLCEWIVY